MNDDLISRADAIDIVNRYNQSHMILKGKPIVGAASMVIEMEDLPSAQPEIIRCRDCKYFAGEGMYCGQNICVQFDHFYCYYGERKE